MKTRKIVALLLCAVLLVGASVMGTLAYLTDKTNDVTNTFKTVGKVHFDDDPETTDLNEGLTESYVDVYGEKYLKAGEGDNAEPVEVDNQAAADRVNGNEYKLMPGHTYIKDPELKIADDSEACWVFAHVENGLASVKDEEGIIVEDGDKSIKAQMTALGWELVDETEDIWGYQTKIEKDPKDADGKPVAKTVPVFNTITIKDDVEADDLEKFQNKTIVITAYAVQADGFDTAADAWAEAMCKCVKE